MKTIYIGIASLDDTELVPTVLNAFESAKDPSRVFVGVSLLARDKWREKDFLKATKKYSKNIRFEYHKLDNKTFGMLTVGNGRRRALNLYSDQDYFLQVDSHAMFVDGWDEKLITLHTDAVNFVKNDKVILTSYAGYYEYSQDGKRVFSNFERTSVENYRLQYPYFVSGMYYHGSIPRWDLVHPQRMDDLQHHKFLPMLKFNANFAFSTADFAHNPGLYEDAEFFEEEIIQTLNLIRLGYTLVYPVLDEPLIGHLYGARIRKGYGDRLSKGDYLGDDFYLSENIATKNYHAFLKDPKNKDVIDIYQDYAKLDLRFGPVRSDYVFPNKFLNSEVTINV